LDASGRTVFGPVVDKLTDISEHIVDRSGLALDPDFDTGYTISAYLLNADELVTDVGQLWGWGTYLQAKDSRDATALRKVAGWDANVSRLTSKITQDAHKVMQSHPEWKASLDLRMLTTVKSYQQLVSSTLFGTNNTTPQQLWTAGQEATMAALALYDAGLPTVEQQLQARLGREVTWRNTLLAVLVASLALGTYFFYCFYLVMRGGLEQVTKHLHAMTEGDLTTHPTPWGRDDIAALMLDLSGMQKALRELISQVRHSSENIYHSSTEIAVGSMDLSSRTEQTASNLEETAAAMEEISSTVQHSATAAQEAAAIATKNADGASEGGRTIAQVVTTMTGIEAASRKISDIIGVIDGIAFQTNILALNAAVEAARAGDQGRGFAVVAGEVRVLAKRSADAAHEIKALIHSSVAQVESGAQIVRSAGHTITELVGNAQRIQELVNDIANGAREQSTGISQVGQAVQQLDQMTQQNAALVEESAAAATAQQASAQALLAQVQRFKLPEAMASATQLALHAGHEPAPDFDFDQAIEAHRAWKVKLRTAIQRKEQLDAATICRDDRCPLGKWLHGAGGRQYGSRPRFVELVDKHRGFHESAGAIAQLINQHRYGEATRLMDSGSAFAENSTAVAMTLSGIKRLGV